MKVKTLKLVLILAAVFAVLYMSSSKVRRVFSIYAQGQSEVLKDYDLESLSVSERGAVYFVGGDFGALNTDTLRGSAAPWSLLASLIALNHVEGDLDKVTWRPLMTPLPNGALPAEHILPIGQKGLQGQN